jgi:CsoR family transcriptional regulator, copper-sensing transcriptional repressor
LIGMADNISSSLNRIEGQVRGVKRMYEEGRDCEQITQQISAIQKALTRVGKTILTSEAVKCSKGQNSEKEMERILENLLKIA